MISREILRKLLDLEDLPTLPQVMNQIIETVENDRSSSEDLTRVLECDHAISARILRMANSAFYGLPTQVNSIRQAVVLVGFDTVRMLALATSVFGVLSGRKQRALDPEDFWMHSFGAAKASQIITDEYCRVDSPVTCFTGSLLHDIGKYLLALVMGEEYEAVCKEALASGRPVQEIERLALGTTHIEVGAWIAEKWLFPPLIIDIIRRRNNPPPSGFPCSAEIGVVALSDVISRLAGFGLACSPEVTPASPELANTIDLDDTTVIHIADRLKQVRDDTRDLLNLISDA